MLRIVGYSDKFCVAPGDTIKFYVSSYESESYGADIVRLIHGDTNPDGPGYKEELIKSDLLDNYKGAPQDIHIGSYVIVPNDDRLNMKSFTLQAMIYPAMRWSSRRTVVLDFGLGVRKGWRRCPPACRC